MSDLDSLFSSGGSQRLFARKLLALRKPTDSTDKQLCPEWAKWLIGVHEHISQTTGDEPIPRPPKVCRDLDDDDAWTGFVGLLRKERDRRKLFIPKESLASASQAVTVPILFVDANDRGVIAKLELQIIPGTGKAYRHPALSFITFDDHWFDAIDQALRASKHRKGWLKSENLSNVDLVWNVILKNDVGLPVNGACGGGSAAGAFDLGLHLLQNPTAIEQHSGIAVTAGISGNFWTEVDGYLQKLSAVWDEAHPPLDTVLVAKVSTDTSKLASVLSGYQPLGDGAFHFSNRKRSLAIIPATDLLDGLHRLKKVSRIKSWREDFPVDCVSDRLSAKSDIEQKLLVEMDRLQKRGKTSLWLHGPPGSGKTWLLKFLYELRTRGGDPPFHHFCQADESGASVVRELQSQVLAWQKIHLDETANDGESLRPHDGAWFLLDGVNQISEGLEDLQNFIRKTGSNAVWVFSSVYPNPEAGMPRGVNCRIISVDDFRDLTQLAREMIQRRNAKLPGTAQLSDELIDTILETPPVPLVIENCFDDIENAEPGSAHREVNFWMREASTVARTRLQRQEQRLHELSGPDGTAKLMLTILSLLQRWPGDGLRQDEETIRLLTGQSFANFPELFGSVAWLFEKESLNFAHPSYSAAIRSLWAPDGSLFLRHARGTLARSCLAILEEFFKEAQRSPLSLDPLQIERYALRTATLYLFRAAGMGSDWAWLLVNWTYLRQCFRHFGALELFACFPDTAQVAERSGMSASEVASVMTLRRILKDQHAFLDARRDELMRRRH
jgi:hypothetical protein